jgi:hypothetical protein
VGSLHLLCLIPVHVPSSIMSKIMNLIPSFRFFVIDLLTCKRISIKSLLIEPCPVLINRHTSLYLLWIVCQKGMRSGGLTGLERKITLVLPWLRLKLDMFLWGLVVKLLVASERVRRLSMAPGERQWSALILDCLVKVASCSALFHFSNI